MLQVLLMALLLSPATGSARVYCSNNGAISGNAPVCEFDRLANVRARDPAPIPDTLLGLLPGCHMSGCCAPLSLLGSMPAVDVWPMTPIHTPSLIPLPLTGTRQRLDRPPKTPYFA